MAIVKAFSSEWYWRIAFQLEADPLGLTFAVYAGVLEEGEMQDTYRPIQWGGQGQLLPDSRKEKISRWKAEDIFPHEFRHLVDEGYVYRD